MFQIFVTFYISVVTHHRSISYTNGCSQSIDLQTHNHATHHIIAHPTHHHSVNDMLHASGPLAKKSYRPVCEPVLFHRSNRPIVRFSSWNIENFGCEKAENPGVKEVIVMTILENGSVF